jgi:orotate phosphoribosyltransferase
MARPRAVDGVLVTRAHYLEDAFESPARLVERMAAANVASVRFDTLVGTGLSGALVIPRLAESLALHWMIVRKDNDGTHSAYNTEGACGEQWLFVDDLISSGATYARVREAMEKMSKRYTHTTECVGAYLYADNYFVAPGETVRERMETEGLA